VLIGPDDEAELVRLTDGDFFDVVFDATGNPQSPSDPHRSGEIWGQTLWDLRAVLGSNVSEKIITGAMRISPANPSFLEERDAIMMADQTSYQGIHIAAIWAVFAHRGMGVLATTAGPNSRVTTPDTHVPADFPAPAPAPGVVAAGGATPLGVPASAVAAGHALARPTARVDRSTVRGRATVTIGCSIACRVTATMTLTRARARRVGLGRVTSLVRVTRRLGAPARRTIGLNLSRATLRRLRAKGVTSLPATVTVAIRDDRGQTRSVRRTLTVRIQ